MPKAHPWRARATSEVPQPASMAIYSEDIFPGNYPFYTTGPYLSPGDGVVSPVATSLYNPLDTSCLR